MMRMSLLAVCVFELSPFARTQVRATEREVAPTLSAAEATAFAFCREYADRQRAAGGDRGSHSYRGHPKGYTVVSAVRDAAGVWSFTESGADPVHTDPGEGLAYFVPERDGGARYVFCVRGDGVAAFTPNAAGLTVRGERPFPADAALCEGGPGSPRDFARTPIRGRDGNQWQPLATLPLQELRLVVLDEHGKPMPMTDVSCAPVDPAFVVDATLPVGTVRTTLDGDAVLVGPPARGLGFVLHVPPGDTLVGPHDVAVRDHTATIRVSRATLRRIRIQDNEGQAMSLVKRLSSSQALFKAAKVIDENGNGAGEYGTFAELSGAVPLRGGTATIEHPVLSAAFGRVEDGVLVRRGYCFRMFLPGNGGEALGEAADGGAAGLAIDAGLAELHWCVYAWPVEAGETGELSFLMNEGGDLISTRAADNRYSGKVKPPAPDAAYDPAGSGKLNTPAARSAQGRDGGLWAVRG